MERILNAIPTFVQDGINIAAGIMPALGFAILLQMLLKKDVFVYFVIGFALFSYLHVPILGIAIFGACLAYIIVNMETKAAMGSRGRRWLKMTSSGKALTKDDLTKICIRSCALEASWNFERQQHMGFAFAMMPALEKIYSGNEEEKQKAAQRHLEFLTQLRHYQHS